MLFLFCLKKKQLTKEELIEQHNKHIKLFIAIDNNSLKDVRLCLQDGADPNIPILNSPINTTLLQYAIHKLKELEYANQEDPDLRIVKLLLLEGASPIQQDQLKRDAFFYASPIYETRGIAAERAAKTSSTLTLLLSQKHPQITTKNVKKISKILTRDPNSKLNKLCNDALKHIVSFLFTDPEKTKVFLRQLDKRTKLRKNI